MEHKRIGSETRIVRNLTRIKRSTWAWLNTIALVVTIVVNALANYLPFNGLSTGQVAALHPNLFTPAPVTFSIWGVIYFLLAGFVIYQWKVFVKKNDFAVSQYAELSMWFILSCILNAGWLLAWHYLLTALSVIIMLTLFYTLTRIFLLLDRIERNHVLEKILIHLPFTIYLAWITVATIANITSWLVSVGFTGGIIHEEIWTTIMMIVAAVLATAITLKFNVAGFPLVIYWALLGIFIRHEGSYALISYTAVSLMVVMALLTLYLLLTKKEKLFL